MIIVLLNSNVFVCSVSIKNAFMRIKKIMLITFLIIYYRVAKYF